MLTFAQPVAPRLRYADRTMEFVAARDALRRRQVIHEYDPLEAALAEEEADDPYAL